MTTTYNIHSSYGFIGFCFINSNQQFKQGGLSLFETVITGNTQTLYQQASIHHLYEAAKTDISIIQDLMQRSIPNLRSTGLTYSAIDVNGTSHTI